MAAVTDLTFAQWFKNIHTDIFGVFQFYRNIYCHRAKMAFLCTQLSNFQKKMNTMQFPAEFPTPIQIQVLRDILKLIAELRQLFCYLDSNHFYEFVTNADATYVKVFTDKFREEFNNLCNTFPFVPQNPLPSDLSQEITDDRADCADIIKRISEVIQSCQLPPEQNQIFAMRLAEYQQCLASLSTAQLQGSHQTNNLSAVQLRQRLELEDRFYLPKSDFVIKKKIGAGGYADVFEGIQQSTQKIVAIKILHNNDFSEAVFISFKREIEIQAKMNNFAILPLVGVCLEPPLYIATEFMPKDCLFKRLHAPTKLDPTQRTIIALGIALGLAYMHRLKYIHRDIKSLNILLDADDYPKIIDFGMSRLMPNGKELMTGGVGTAQWEAPEVINNMPYSEKADVYSFGILLWEILTCDLPFRNLTQMQVAMGVVSNGIRPVIPNVAPPKIIKMIKLCWDQDPTRRPSMESVVRAIACGEVIFPGTKMADVQAYMARFGDDPILTTLNDKNNKNIPGMQPGNTSSGEFNNYGHNPQKMAMNRNRAMTKIDKEPSHSRANHRHSIQSKNTTPPNEMKVTNLIDLNNPNPALIPGLVELLKGPHQESLINTLVQICTNNKPWCATLRDSEVYKILIDLLNTSTNPVLVQKIYAIFVRFLSNGINLSEAMPSVFASFQRLGNTSMADVLILILGAIAVGHEPPCNEAFIQKVAAFLQAGNMNCRMDTIKVLEQIISKSQNLKQFAIIFAPSIANLIPKGEILSQTINIIYHLVVNGQLAKEFVDAGGLVSILLLLIPSDPSTETMGPEDKAKVFQILTAVVKVPIPDEQLLRFSEMLAVAKRILNSTEILSFLACTSFAFMKYDLSPMILQKFTSFVISCYTSDDPRIVLIALKISFFFLQSPDTRKPFLDCGKEFTTLLNPQVPAIASVAASCLIQVYASLEGDKYLDLLNEQLFNFLVFSLQSEFELTPYALRLFGVISLTYDGANFLNSNNIPQLAGNFMCSSTPEFRLLGFQAFTAFVCTYPMSETALAATTLATQNLSEKDLAPYPLLMLSSLIVCPVAAVNIAPNISNLINLLDDSQSQTGLVLQALSKIFGTLEARDYFTDADALTQLFNKGEMFYGTPQWWTLVELVDMATGTKTGFEAVAHSTIATYLKQSIQSKNITRKQKWHINRVFIRLGLSASA